MSTGRKLVALVLLGIVCPALSGCKNKPVVEAMPDYSRQLPPGASALRLITDPARMPDLAAAYRSFDEFHLAALDQSITWFKARSSQQFYPFEDFTHDQQRASLEAMKQLLTESTSAEEFQQDALKLFDVYESVGYNNEGTVLFTGYYAPTFEASVTPTDRFRFPLYKRPTDLVTDPISGEPRGRQMPDGTTQPYPTRREIETSNMLAGLELVYLENPLSVYIIQVNGSAKLRMPDGELMYIGYAGKTDRPYVGLGQSVVEEGLIPKEKLGLPAIKQLYRERPETIQELIYRNESYVFFTEYPGRNWPAGSLGVRVTPETTLATDKKVYPRGGIVLVDTQAVNFSYQKRDFLRFMFDQDTGGAIRAPGRADMYMGDGPSAEILAGGQYAEGRLFYLFLKQDFVAQYLPVTGGGTRTATGGTAGE